MEPNILMTLIEISNTIHIYLYKNVLIRFQELIYIHKCMYVIKQAIKHGWKNLLCFNNKYWHILHHKAWSRNWYILLEVQFAAYLHFLFILKLDLPNTKLFFQRRAFPIVFSPSCKFLPSHPINRGIGSYIII